ncbi:glycosyltransferase family 2 protein [Acinetobacter sp. C_4_1]|uniref:glycosyltransferase family 2 protein n=1 Tax=unclassified Acinetobacter TaxID=196816 RepID=UPI0021B80409|nr:MULTISPECIES: glycosyltransferase family 2 protein [unclassified Acinetobacter]MCT8089476.1 glycosyltransferase family 2 protein [Acinetobacter sp. F_3_1]MCT8098156.1 glycosyltransferase family 2 protein [Acinetobacter sp. C_3_1]MCT8101072.1 glycosyltransferase family 2 protein [Acinetobacter sp. C_4_1]MCT8134823.1 glycosyltransferase family 2 protein [Acinetobacter sp. T_3_1]
MIAAQSKVFAVIVTYNRKELLLQCLSALNDQTHRLSQIVIVDNASTDDTLQVLKKSGFLNTKNIHLIALAENTGGAGGFSVGMTCAFEQGADYVWMMDDDALPHFTALEELVKHAVPEAIFGSLAVNKESTAWTTTLLPKFKVVNLKLDVPDKSEVQSLPFLGFLTSKEIYQKIGLPNESYFIAADDTEYCMRAQKAGYKIFICGASQIEHPKSDRYEVNIFIKKINCLKLVPWKRYYDTRNRIFIAKSYYGIKLYTQTIPSLVLRLFAALLYESDRKKQIKAFLVGLYDGLSNHAGKRHDYWNL